MDRVRIGCEAVEKATALERSSKYVRCCDQFRC